MKYSTPVFISLSFFLVFGSVALNFQEFLMGSTATMKNLIVTIVYFVAWISIIVMCSKSKNLILIKFFSVFWLVTLIFAIITAVANMIDKEVAWAIPTIILTLTPWYGVRFFVESYFSSSVIIAFFSLIIILLTVLLIKRLK